MRKRPKKGGRSEGGAGAALNAAQKGDFGPLLEDEVDAWWNFVGEHLELGTNRLMLRIEAQDPRGPWYLWLVYDVDHGDKSLALSELMLPNDETMANRAGTATATPEGYEQVPYFPYRRPS